MRLLAFFGFGWSKWTTVETNKKMYQEVTNPILVLVSSGYVYIDAVNKQYAPTSRSKDRESFDNYTLIEYFGTR